MFRFSSYALLAAVLAWLAAADTRSAPDLTVVLDFKGTHSDRSVNEMEREAEGILKPSGLRLDWRLRADAAAESYKDLVVVRFKGACKVEPVPYVYDELGPLAFTYATDGTLQPFGEVACDQVAASVRSAMAGSDFEQADVLLGRALGRVLVHELVHMLTKSAHHAREGVERQALSGRELIAASLPLSPVDLEHLRQIQRGR